MRVYINCEVNFGGGSGGAEQFVSCLLHGLGQLGSDHEFLIGVWPGSEEWLEPFLGDGMRLVEFPIAKPPQRSALERRIRSVLSPFKRKVKALLGRPAIPPPPAPGATSSFIDALEPDVCHFPWQKWVPTAAPSILNLHDLQHLHFPQFFTDEQLQGREQWISWAQEADILPASSEWTARDFVEKLRVPPSKVKVVLGASPLEIVPSPSKELVAELRERLALPEVFALYPATTWPHKNHVALAEALAVADVPALSIICTGFKTDAWGPVEETVAQLGLDGRFRLLGFVTPEELKALYRLATFVVVPSLFEGGGSAAMYEALGEGVPLACSDIPSIPEGMRDAALLFDPTSVEAIAQAIRRMVREPELRDRLRAASLEKAKQYSLRQFARRYLGLYEELAVRGRPRELHRA